MCNLEDENIYCAWISSLLHSALDILTLVIMEAEYSSVFPQPHVLVEGCFSMLSEKVKPMEMGQ